MTITGDITNTRFVRQSAIRKYDLWLLPKIIGYWTWY